MGRSHLHAQILEAAVIWMVYKGAGIARKDSLPVPHRLPETGKRHCLRFWSGHNMQRKRTGGKARF